MVPAVHERRVSLTVVEKRVSLTVVEKRVSLLHMGRVEGVPAAHG